MTPIRVRRLTVCPHVCPTFNDCLIKIRDWWSYSRALGLWSEGLKAETHRLKQLFKSWILISEGAENWHKLKSIIWKWLMTFCHRENIFLRINSLRVEKVVFRKSFFFGSPASINWSFILFCYQMWAESIDPRQAAYQSIITALSFFDQDSRT